MIYLAIAYKYASNGRILAREEWIILAKNEGEARNRLTKIPGLVIVGIRPGESCQLARLSTKAL